MSEKTSSTALARVRAIFLEHLQSLGKVFEADVAYPLVPFQTVKKRGEIDHPGTGVDELQVQ